MTVVIKHAPHEGLGTSEKTLASLGQQFSLLEASGASEAEWKAAREARALIVMGGAMGVYEADRHPFLATELELLKERVAGDRPTLGIRLVAQLLAVASGG